MRLISPVALRQYIAFRGFSYSELGVRSDNSKSLIGHLATGERTATSPDRARRIAKALDVPVEALFVPEVSTVKRDTRHRAGVPA
ncbi:helix-turn-helix domain-containing protein [Luteimicrobium sp. NPDC057192]|uniref:helix-turn-helix domain-containing protein n=1 Tax=Luteimicrobium sp. NPDC057192 TaxID=3346042 RepID=UPI00363CAABC